MDRAHERNFVMLIRTGRRARAPLGFLAGLIVSGELLAALPAAQAQGPPAAWKARPPVHIRRAATATPGGYYGPQQIRHAYGIDTLTGSGAGQVIAIVDAYGSPSIQRDLNTCCDYYGLPRTKVVVVYPQGKPRTNGGWALETSLDVEWAHAIAPGATILLEACASASLSNLVGGVNDAVNRGATVVSMSWGGSEWPTESSYDVFFDKPGVSFF